MTSDVYLVSYPAQTITDADNADGMALLANTPTQGESLPHNLEKAADGIDLHVNVNKTEYMCFNQNQTRDISTLTGGFLKIVDKFTYLGSNVLSTENDINTPLGKAWFAIDRLSVIWKSNLSDKIKYNISKQQLCLIYYIDAPHGRWLFTRRKSLTAIAQEFYELCWTNPGSNIPQNSSCAATFLPSLKRFKLDEQYMRDSVGEVRVSSSAMFS